MIGNLKTTSISVAASTTCNYFYCSLVLKIVRYKTNVFTHLILWINFLILQMCFKKAAISLVKATYSLKL